MGTSAHGRIGPASIQPPPESSSLNDIGTGFRLPLPLGEGWGAGSRSTEEAQSALTLTLSLEGEGRGAPCCCCCWGLHLVSMPLEGEEPCAPPS